MSEAAVDPDMVVYKSSMDRSRDADWSSALRYLGLRKRNGVVKDCVVGEGVL